MFAVGTRHSGSCPPGIADYVASLERRLAPKAIILFGSRARGDADRFSDYDLLVVADDLPADYWQRLDVLWEDKPPLVDALGFTEEELSAFLHRGLILDALLEGRPLVGDIQTWRRRAQRYLQEHGLVKKWFGYVRRSPEATVQAEKE
jgi:predicted nucleotidyltransferase